MHPEIKNHICIISPEYTAFQGSECALGWNLSLNIALENPQNHYTVIAATGSWKNQNSYSTDFELYQTKFPLPANLTVQFLPYPKLARLLVLVNHYFSKLSPVGNSLIFFKINALWYDSIIKFINIDRFDLIHLLTPISYKKNAFAFKIKLPTVTGPTGGFTKLNTYRNGLPLKVRLIEKIRNLTIQLDHNLGNHFKYKRLHNYILFDRTEANYFKDYNPIILPDSATLGQKIQEKAKSGDKLNLLIVGQLTVRKQPFLLLEALKNSKSLRNFYHVKIIGSGPLEIDLKSYVDKHKLNDCVELIGQVEREILDIYYSQANLLIHLSYREAATHTIPEAISFGLGVIAHDIGGIREFVCEDNGHLIDLESIEFSIHHLKKVLFKYASNKQLRQMWSTNSIKKSNELTYSRMAKLIALEHQRLINLK